MATNPRPAPVVTIEKAWDGNDCETERNGRIYVSRGRWQWIVLVNGVADMAFDRKREAVSRRAQILDGR